MDPSASCSPTPSDRTIGTSRIRRYGRRCRPYTSVLLVVVGLVIGALLWSIGVWWGLVIGVIAAFWFGAAIARPWCRANVSDSGPQG